MRKRNRVIYLTALWLFFLLAIGVFTQVATYLEEYIREINMSDDEKRYSEYNKWQENKSRLITNFDSIYIIDNNCISSYLLHLMFIDNTEASVYLKGFDSYYILFDIKERDMTKKYAPPPYNKDPFISLRDVQMEIIETELSIGMDISSNREVLHIGIEHGAYCGSSGCDGFDATFNEKSNIVSVSYNRVSTNIKKNTRDILTKIKRSKIYNNVIIPWNKSRGIDCVSSGL